MSAHGERREPGPAWRDAVVAHYEARLREFGPTARGMDWRDEASQTLRFEVLCGGLSLDAASLLEVGAGAGHLSDFLAERGADMRYTGIDLSARMVAAARARRPGVRFERRDLLEWETDETWDAVVGSGLFHVKLDAPEGSWREFVRETVRRMYERCERVIAFNLMSDQVDFRAPELHYADPREVFEFCRRELSRRVALRHDYPLHEFTVHVYRDGRR